MELLVSNQQYVKSCSLQEESSYSRPSAIPITRQKLVNDTRLGKRIVVEGRRSFSKIVCSGEKTWFKLRQLQRAIKLKVLLNFEFDPYLCDCSHIKPLARVLKTLKYTKSLHLILRRSDYLNETDAVFPMIPRINRLDKLKVELMSKLLINDDGFIHFLEAGLQCRSVKTLDVSMLCLKELTPKSSKALLITRRKYSHIENFITRLVKDGTIHSEGPPKITPKPLRMPRIKRMELSVAMNTGWVSVQSGPEEDPSPHFRFSGECKNLKEFVCKYRGITISSEFMIGFMKVIIEKESLRLVDLEFLNCHLGDQETMILAFQILKLAQVKRISLKVIQYPNISEICVINLVTAFSRLENLDHFDVFLRRLSIEDENLIQLVDRINQLNNIKCVISKQSLHIFKGDNTTLNSDLVTKGKSNFYC